VLKEDSQLVAEAKFRGIYDDEGSGSSITSIRSYFIQEDKQMDALQCALSHGFRTELDLVASELICYKYKQYGTRIVLPPKYGPVCVDILINSMPVLARVSYTSLYTIVSERPVQALGLVEKDHSTTKIEKIGSYQGQEIQKSDLYLSRTCHNPHWQH